MLVLSGKSRHCSLEAFLLPSYQLQTLLTLEARLLYGTVQSNVKKLHVNLLIADGFQVHCVLFCSDGISHLAPKHLHESYFSTAEG